MMYPEFQKHFRLFPKVFHTHFSGTAERSVFGVQRTPSEPFREGSPEIIFLFDLQINKFFGNGPPTVLS